MIAYMFAEMHPEQYNTVYRS